MSLPEKEIKTPIKATPKTKAAKEKPSGFSFVEETTTVTIEGITEKAGKRLEACLKGQVQNSTDHQLRSAIRAHLGREKVSFTSVNIDRG